MINLKGVSIDKGIILIVEAAEGNNLDFYIQNWRL